MLELPERSLVIGRRSFAEYDGAQPQNRRLTTND